MKATITPYQLNAFVDGELPADEAALVATAIASDPELAQRAAQLHRMKAVLGSFVSDMPLPEAPQAIPRQRRAWRKLAACASIAAMALLLASTPISIPESAPAELNRLAQHDRWLSGAGPVDGIALPAGAEWIEPVMRASGLQLVHLEQGQEATHFGFKGPNACRLSLFITAAEMPSAPLWMALSADIQQARWHSGGYSFEMIARDMAMTRFATVATGLQQGSDRHEKDQGMRLALIQSARLPCLA